MSQQVLNIFRENLKSLQTLNFAFRDDTGCPNKFWIGSEMLANKVSIVLKKIVFSLQKIAFSAFFPELQK